ncbi:hypothetical protein B0T20DRAFT_451971 [Sordaria brevicollis]|uniref:NACHT domain-containing protein n=1 Tax=Sordaria brevicollis TaxID=83679 RepID=A0AAE0PGX7_SORBR|nr:hypothetical protein B0T20DRAFT_451971 [Sordaria brevicollis]
MTTDDFKHDGDSDSTQTPNQRFAAVVDDFLSQLSKKDAKHPFMNRSSRALDKLGPFVLSLTELAKFCETVFGASPMAVAAIFSGARMVLMLALNAQECFNTVIEAVDEIDTYLHCYDNFYDAYRDDPVMQSRLVVSYRNILEFWWESIKILSNSVLKSIAKGLIAPLDKDIKDSLRAIKEDRSSVQYMLRDQIIPWIAGPEGPSQLDPRHNLYDMQELHHQGTCSWIFNHAGYKEWDGPGAWTGRKSDPVLWYSAPPGCGKTVMASQIVRYLKQENHKVVWYFCSFDDPIRRDPRNVLRSIAIQLLCRYVSKRIPDKVVDMFREDQSTYNNFINHESQLMAVVHELLKAMSLAYIVVDGLDEIIGMDQERPYPFHGMFGQLILQASERHGTTKWCFTSRDEGPVRATMEGVNALQVIPSSANLAADIKAYLEDRLSEKKLSPDRIEDLVEASEGNFLYAKLRADTLLGQGVTCEEEVEEELRTYPKGLSGCYLRSLEKLNYRTTYEQELASADGLPESFENDPEHAFLRYASVFWFQHLDMRGVACEEIRQEVRKFLKSGGFWTAFRVQTRVARYLFARYAQRGSCGYSMRADASEWTTSDFIASTIPLCTSPWSGTRRSRLARTYYCSVPLILRLPVSSRAEQSSWKRTSSASLWARSPVDLQARHVGSFGSLPVVNPPGMYSICRRRLDVTVVTANGERPHPLPKRLVNECSSDKPQGWQFVDEVRFASDLAANASVVCHFARVQRHSQSIARLRGSAGGAGQQEAETSDDDPSAYDEQKEGEEFDEEEFDEEEEDSDSETASETEGDSSAIDSSTDATEPEGDTVTDVLVVIREEGDPVWIPCPGSQKSKRQMAGSLHPNKPFFVWAQDADRLNVMNTGSGKTATFNLPQLPKENISLRLQGPTVATEQVPNIGTRFGSRLLTEIRFSSDGSLLHVLVVRFEAASSHVTKATVALVTFRFESGDDVATEKPTLEQCGNVLSAAYLFYKRVDDLPVPLGVVYWSSDVVYLGLPLLTCSVKFIRMPLNLSTSADSESQPRIQTVDRTILIPSSAYQRRPRLLYQSSMSKTKTDDSLYLVLDPEPLRATPAEANCHYMQESGCSDQCDHEDIAVWPHKQGGFHRGGASVIRWSIPREGGWRDWEPEKDSISDELQSNPSLCTFDELRGTFIDADKMFSVPIRGALNFTWKGYLSCG